MVGEVGEANLHGSSGKADGPHDQAHGSLLTGEHVLDGASTFDLAPFARETFTGMGRPGGFLRWI